MSFNGAPYGLAFAELIPADRRRALGPGRPEAGAKNLLRDATIESAFAGFDVSDPQLAACCLSAVWLVNDLLDESHTLSQGIETAEGSFWHAIMHRREGDFSNAKYWFRRVGDHAVLTQLAEQFGAWDPCEFVDRCEAAVRRDVDIEACLDAQQAEWELLFDWCFQGAVGR
jgi:hypothetical protein